MSQDYIEKFEIIKQGIGSIFTQIQAGMSQYSRTVLDSTQNYLNKYSSSLKETTDSLAATIELQREAIEMIVDSVNSRKK